MRHRKDAAARALRLAAAPSRWPVIDLMRRCADVRTWSPRTPATASVRECRPRGSKFRVRSHSRYPGLMSASLMASRIAFIAPPAPGVGSREVVGVGREAPPPNLVDLRRVPWRAFILPRGSAPRRPADHAVAVPVEGARAHGDRRCASRALVRELERRQRASVGPQPPNRP